MNDLLETVIKAHGGLERWNQLNSVSARLSHRAFRAGPSSLLRERLSIERCLPGSRRGVDFPPSSLPPFRI
jgi:hypothetical protein